LREIPKSLDGEASLETGRGSKCGKWTIKKKWD